MDIKKQIGKEVGASGTVIMSGIISAEEYNRDLSGQRGLKVYDEMRKSDSTVRASLQAVKLPIMAADKFIQPASDSTKDVQVADFVEHNLFNVLDYDSFLRQCLTMLDFGFFVAEKVFEPMEFNGKTFIGYSKLASRKQSSIYGWETRDHEPGITQFTIAKGAVDIPIEKLVVFTNEQEGENYAGVSIIRGAYKHWYIKDSLYKIDAMAHERQGLGIIKIKRPSEAADAEKQAARTAARQARANEESYIEEPEGWDINFMDMMAHTTRDPMNSIAHHDRQIMKNVLAQFLEIGAQQSSGSYSASSDHSRLFELSLEAVAKNLISTINEQIIRPLVDINFTVKEYPKLHLGKIGDENIPVFADAIQKLTSAGVLTATVDVEDTVRGVLHLADTPDEIEAIYAKKLEDAANPPTPPAAPPIDPKAPPADPEAVEAHDLLRTAKAFQEFLVDKSDQYVDA